MDIADVASIHISQKPRLQKLWVGLLNPIKPHPLLVDNCHHALAFSLQFSKTNIGKIQEWLYLNFHIFTSLVRIFMYTSHAHEKGSISADMSMTCMVGKLAS